MLDSNYKKRKKKNEDKKNAAGMVARELTKY